MSFCYLLNSTTLRNSWLEFSWKERKRTDDLPGVVFAAEYSHKVGDGDAPLPPDVEVLERPSDVVFPDKHVPVDSCRKEFLVRPKGTSKMTRERGREGGGQKRSAHAPPNKRRTAISPGPKGNGVGIEEKLERSRNWGDSIRDSRTESVERHRV